MSNKSYQIKKVLVVEGKILHVLLLNPYDEVFETDSHEEVLKMCEIFNRNSDSGWKYEIVSILKI
tara:strand:- start:3297 stop:3491 length:195 start_codon:yes stop_codon:yes gene_type:complete